MKITSIKFHKITEDNRLKAVATVEINNTLLIDDVKVIKGDDRLFVAMPSDKSDDAATAAFRDIIHPIGSDSRRSFEDVILTAFTKHVSGETAYVITEANNATASPELAITNVKVREIYTDTADSKLKARVSITIDDCLAVHDIRIIKGNKRMYAAFPARIDENGAYHEYVSFKMLSTRDEYEKVILDSFNRCALAAANM